MVVAGNTEPDTFETLTVAGQEVRKTSGNMGSLDFLVLRKKSFTVRVVIH